MSFNAFLFFFFALALASAFPPHSYVDSEVAAVARAYGVEYSKEKIIWSLAGGSMLPSNAKNAHVHFPMLIAELVILAIIAGLYWMGPGRSSTKQAGEI